LRDSILKSKSPEPSLKTAVLLTVKTPSTVVAPEKVEVFVTTISSAFKLSVTLTFPVTLAFPVIH
jgi:hypothetical protein